MEPRKHYALPPPTDQMPLWAGGCERCNGAGRIPDLLTLAGDLADGGPEADQPCPECGGSGLGPDDRPP